MRVVQDSEDEEDFDVTNPTASPANSAGNSGEQRDETVTRRTESTNETDILCREIRIAQKQLMDHPQKVNVSSRAAADATTASSSPLHSSSKRRKTSSAAISTTSTKEHSKRRKTLKTYSGSRKIETLGDSSAENLALNAQSAVGYSKVHSTDSRSNLDRQHVDEHWDLLPSIRDDFVRHNPLCLFPEASSTVPDNTNTQKRLIEEVLTVDQLHSSHLQEVAGERSTSSIPWSEFLTTQESPAKPVQRPETPGSIPSNPASTLKSRPNAIPDDAEPSNTLVAPVPDATSNRLKGTKRAGESVADLEDQLTGLPLEHYQPRPSRSRSTRMIEHEPVDYSKRPELRTKTRAKRRKTANDVVMNAEHMSTPEKVNAISNMGFSPTQAALALEGTLGVVEEAISHLIAQSGTETKVSSGIRSKRTAALRSVSVVIPPVNVEPNSIGCDDDRTVSLEAAENVQHKISHSTNDLPEDAEKAGHPQQFLLHTPQAELVETLLNDELNLRPTPKQTAAKRRKSNQKKALQDDPTSHGEESSKAIPKEKPRGRGRPRKDATVPAVIQPFDDQGQMPQSSRQKEGIDPPPEPAVLKQIVPNHLKAPSINKIDEQGDANAPSCTSPELRTPAATPERKASESKNRIDHSPLSKSKVPLRVGLSKKIRIAPLLKIFNK